MDKERLSELRSRGIMLQRDGEKFSVRVGAAGGTISSKELRALAELCERFGDGTVHLTTRQAIEIHHVPMDSIDEFIDAFESFCLTPARSGARIRTIVACPGNEVCKFAGIDSQRIAREIEERFGNIDSLPSKIKIAVSGCKNCCTRPRYNDIGIMGAGKDRYELFIGGKGGRNPQMGKSQGVYESIEELIDAIEMVIADYAAHAKPKQRIGVWMEED